MFSDVAALLINHLSPVVAPVPMSGRVPKPRPGEFVQLRRVGGPAEDPVMETVRFDVFTWAETDPAAVALSNQIRAAVWALSATNDLGVPVYDVGEFKGPSSDDDPETGTPRVWTTYEVTVRAESAIQPAASAFPDPVIS